MRKTKGNSRERANRQHRALWKKKERKKRFSPSKVGENGHWKSSTRKKTKCFVLDWNKKRFYVHLNVCTWVPLCAPRKGPELPNTGSLISQEEGSRRVSCEEPTPEEATWDTQLLVAGEAREEKKLRRESDFHDDDFNHNTWPNCVKIV